MTFNMGDNTYNDSTYILFYLQITLLITLNKKHTCNVAFIKVISKVIISKYREQNFNLRYGRSFVSHTYFLTEKLPNLKLKTRHKQLLGSLPSP